MFRYTPQIIPSNIFVIGAGGTGSRLIPLLAQFMRTISRGTSGAGWVESPIIWLIDDDTVEQKNINRQNFINSDVGKHKANVLAERYTRAYGIPIIPIVGRVEPGSNAALWDQINTINTAKREHNAQGVDVIRNNSIIVSCVDSAAARRNIMDMFMCRRTQSGTGVGSFFIDSGNEDNFGQVSFFTPVILYGADELDQHFAAGRLDPLPKLVTSVVDVDFIPFDHEYYMGLVDTPAQGSCADLDQTLAINALMATTIMGTIQNYYYRKPFTHNCIRLSLDGANSTEYNTFSNWKRRSVNAEKTATIQNYSVMARERSNPDYLRSQGVNFASLINVHGSVTQKLAEDAAAARAATQVKDVDIEEEDHFPGESDDGRLAVGVGPAATPARPAARRRNPAVTVTGANTGVLNIVQNVVTGEVTGL